MSINIVNNPKAWTLTIADGSTYNGANKITITGIALSLIIDSLAATEAVDCKLNGDAACVFPVSPNASYGWNYNDIQVNTIDFANSSGSDQTITVIAGCIVG